MKASPKQSNNFRVHSTGMYRMLGILGMVFLLGCLIKLFITMYAEGGNWRALGEKLTTEYRKEVIAQRGNIYAASGELLAISPKYYRMYIDFGSESMELLEKKKLSQARLDSLAGVLVKLFPRLPLSKNSLHKRWHRARREQARHFDLIGYDISSIEYERLLSDSLMFTTDPISKKRISRSSIYRCLSSEPRSMRIQPFGDAQLAAYTIGGIFAQSDSAKNGLELSYDSLLRGTPGIAIEEPVAGRTIRHTIQEPIPGGDLYCTLDIGIQNIVQRALREQLLGDKRYMRAGAIVMETHTGRIVALSNLQRTGESSCYETSTHMFSDMLDPGSTFKTVSMMALLDDGKVHANDLIETGNGSARIGGRTVYDTHACGTITMVGAIEQSSNVALALAVNRAYGDNPTAYVDKIYSFGFHDDLHLDLKGGKRPNIRKPNSKGAYWSATTLPWMAHGYETQIPPIYLCTFYNAIANGGTIYRPYLVDSVVNFRRETIFRAEPTPIRSSICKPEVIHDLRHMLHTVVWGERGTAKICRSEIVSISGKTGTAQISGGSQGYRGGAFGYNASFCGYFPSEAPKYTVFISFITYPGSRAYGGPAAGPVVKRIAEEITLREQRIRLDKLEPLPSAGQQPPMACSRVKSIEGLSQQLGFTGAQVDSRSANDIVEVSSMPSGYQLIPLSHTAPKTMPNLIGYNAADAVYTLGQQGISCKLEGYGSVKAQSVAPGSKISTNTVVRLTLGSTTAKATAQITVE